MRNFRELVIWNEGIDLAAQAYEVTKRLPKEEEYGLKSQVRRAAISIPSNISEGCSRTSQKEFKHYLEISLGFAFEVETHLIVAQKLSLISASELSDLFTALHLLQRRLNTLISKVKAISQHS